jgi:hypothetical protein
MVTGVRQLHEARLDDVAEKLRAEGYIVRRGGDAGHGDFDLVAEKDGRRIAVEVKAADELRAAVPEIRRLREVAKGRGFDDFRVTVVNPAEKKSIAIPGLDRVLFELTGNPPLQELAMLSDRSVVTRVYGVDVESIAMNPPHVHAIGSAVASVELNYNQGRATEALTLVTEFPIHFDLLLNSDLTLRQRIALSADTDSFVRP